MCSAGWGLTSPISYEIESERKYTARLVCKLTITLLIMYGFKYGMLRSAWKLLICGRDPVQRYHATNKDKNEQNALDFKRFTSWFHRNFSASNFLKRFKDVYVLCLCLEHNFF